MAAKVDHGSGGGGEHPLLARASEVAALLDSIGDLDPIFLATEEKAAALRIWAANAERAHAVVLRLLGTAADVAEDAGSRSAAAWLGHQTHHTYAAAAADGRLAEALETRYQHLQAAALAGTVTVEQARVIVRALDALPADLDPEIREKAELHLIEQAAHFDPAHLRALGRRVLEVVAPDVADEEERRQLEAEEKRARETTRLTMRARGDGTTDVAVRLPDSAATRLRTYLESYAAPRRASQPDRRLDPTGDHTDPATGERISYPALLGHAFCALLEAVPADKLPRHGGSATTVVVTIDLDRLRDQVGAAELTDDSRISATEALRLACTAHLVPAVLNGKREILHLGRDHRLYNDPQRLAMKLRDRHCRAEGCRIPADWCEAHHAGKPWAQGGRTDIEEGRLLCSWHHHLAHSPGWRTELLPNGDIRFHRRC